jgi:hypothetical protein
MKKDRCPYCNGQGKLSLEKNVGYDITEDGEEHQHLQICDCGANRYITEVWPFAKDETPYNTYGEWTKDNEWKMWI